MLTVCRTWSKQNCASDSAEILTVYERVLYHNKSHVVLSARLRICSDHSYLRVYLYSACQQFNVWLEETQRNGTKLAAEQPSSQTDSQQAIVLMTSLRLPQFVQNCVEMWMWLQTYFHVDDEKFRCLLDDSPTVCWLLAIGPLAAGWLVGCFFKPSPVVTLRLTTMVITIRRRKNKSCNFYSVNTCSTKAAI